MSNVEDYTMFLAPTSATAAAYQSARAEYVSHLYNCGNPDGPCAMRDVLFAAVGEAADKCEDEWRTAQAEAREHYA